MAIPAPDEALDDDALLVEQSTDPPRPYFHQRDPSELAQEADLGEPWPAQLAIVQDFYRQLFEFVDEEAWPDDPQGPFGSQWRGISGAQSTLYLINVSTVIRELMQNASPGVGRTLTERVRTMLRPPDKDTYEEALVELEVGGMLANRVTPVLLEPMVPPNWKPGQGNKPSSPDYGVRVPEALVTVEVTVWHWEAYAAWDRMNQAISTALSARMRKRGVARNIRIELPIGTPQDVAQELWSHDFCDQVCDTESGAIMTTDEAAPRPVRASWHPILHFADHESINWDAVKANGGLPFTTGPNIEHSFGFSINPCITEDDHNDALESLRKSIDRKKRQRDARLPHLVAISPTVQRIAVSPNEFARTWDVFGPLIDQRLWPNPKYQWLSGILEFNKNRVATPSDLNYFVGYTPNPNAAIPLPKTMDRVLRGEEEFHAMWQRPRRPAS